MIAERLIREALTPDPLETAKSRVQTRAYRAEIERRKALVHSALARCVPTQPVGSGCSGSAS